MTINYDTLTTEQIEEYAEFIDWSTIPSRFLIEEIKDKFGSIPQLNARIWFDELFLKMVVKVDQKQYAGWIFFFIDGVRYMNLRPIDGQLWCSEERIWSVIKNKIRYDHEETRLFIKKVMEQHFKNIEVEPVKMNFNDEVSHSFLKEHFKKIEVTPVDTFDIINSMLEEAIKKIK